MIRKNLSRHWGLAYFLIFSAVGMGKLLSQPFPEHYLIFTRAARALWHGMPAYGTDFGTRLGFYFYSPTCGLFFFGPFALLPVKLGLFLYMSGSWLIFLIGLYLLWKKMVGSKWGTDEERWARNCLLFALADQMHLALVTSKLEVMIAGLTLLCAYWILIGELRFLSAILFALIVNWKGQPLPTALLLILVLVMSEKDWRWPLYFFSGLVGFFALPLLTMSFSRLWRLQTARYETLSRFIGRDWLLFDHPFKLLKNGVGLPVSLQTQQAIALGVAILFGVSVIVWIFRALAGSTGAKALVGGVELSLALGAAFTCLFSPLNQNNGYILYTPLLMAGFLSFLFSHDFWRKYYAGLLVFVWAVMSLSYSDLMPKPFRDDLRLIAFKSVAIIVLTLSLLISTLSASWQSQLATD